MGGSTRLALDKVRMYIEYEPVLCPRMSIEASLRSDAWALSKISEYKGGKILIWSWLSRGLISMEWVAKIHFGNSLEQAKEAMGQVRTFLFHYDLQSEYFCFLPGSVLDIYLREVVRPSSS